MSLEHQDFTPVIIKKHKPTLPPTVSVDLALVSVNTLLENKLAKEESIEKIKPELKNKFISLRNAAKLNQQQLAQKINIKIDKIKLLEQGKLSQKEAVQICIKASKTIGNIL